MNANAVWMKRSGGNVVNEIRICVSCWDNLDACTTWKQEREAIGEARNIWMWEYECVTYTNG